MTGTIFDLYQSDINELPNDQQGYLEFANRAPIPKDDSWLSTVKDYATTALKGATEGFSRAGSIMGPTGELGILGQREKELESQTKELNKLLPVEEDFGQRALRRGLGQAPSMMAFPGTSLVQMLPRSLAAGFIGEGAKDLGLPEWAQAAGELTAYIGPDLTKKLLQQGKNADIIKFAKEAGISDEAITPLLQSDFKQKWLSKFVPRRGRIQNVLGKTKEELGSAYGKLEGSEAAAQKLSPESENLFFDEIIKVRDEIPASLREKIDKDLNDLLSKDITGKTLINFYKDINFELSGKTKQLSLFKEPVKQALQKIDPKLAKDFDIINDLFVRFHKISPKFEPNTMTDIIGASESLATLFSLITGRYIETTALVGEKLGRQLARELLVNPRLQQLPEKMIAAAQQNKYGLVLKIVDQYRDEIKKSSPETAEILKDISKDDLIELFSHLQSSK